MLVILEDALRHLDVDFWLELALFYYTKVIHLNCGWVSCLKVMEIPNPFITAFKLFHSM